MKSDARQKWVGLLEIRQHDGIEVLGKNKGAHVTAVVFCKDPREFEKKAKEFLEEYGLYAVAIEEVESCEYRMDNFEVDDAFIKCVKGVSKDNLVSCMTFHTFPLDD